MSEKKRPKLVELGKAIDAYCLAPLNTPPSALVALRDECSRLDKECREAGILPPTR